MTKEEISKSAWDCWQNVNRELHDSGGVNPTPFVLGYKYGFDENAKQEAIGFLKWAVENHSVPYEGFSLSANRLLGGDTKFVDGEEITITQFYELYLKSK